VIAALDSEYYDRVCQIELSDVPSLFLESFKAVTQELFPELTDLHLPLNIVAEGLPDLPDSLLPH